MATVDQKNKAVNRELKEEQEHPDHIIADVLKEDSKKHATTKDFEPKGIDTKSSKLLLYSVLFIFALFAFFIGGKYAFQLFHLKTGNDLSQYNGFSFSQDPETKIWFTTYKEGSTIYPLQFRNHPTEVEDELLLFNVDDLVINRQGILQSLPPVNTSMFSLAAIEIVTKVNNVFGIYSKAGVFAKTPEVTDEVPIITCDNANDSIAVVIYQLGNETEAFELTKNCFIIQGSTYSDVIKMADKVAYSILGIIKGDLE